MRGGVPVLSRSMANGRSRSLAASVEAAQADHPSLDLGAALGTAWQCDWLLGVVLNDPT